MPMNNRERADHALEAVLEYCASKEGRRDFYDDGQTCIKDLICDLCHLLTLDYRNKATAALLLSAHALFEDECADEA